MPAKIIVPVIPSTLMAIREKVGYAHPRDVPLPPKYSEDQIKSWETGQEKISLSEAKTLADKYRVSHVLFYMEDLPDGFQADLPADFRRGTQRQPYSPNLLYAIRETQFRQQWLKDYLQEIDERRFTTLSGSLIDEDPAKVAVKIRNWLGIEMRDIQSCKSKAKAFDKWRDAIEKRGVVVLTNETHKSYKISEKEYDGLAISDKDAPVILLNPGRELKRARSIFTMVHELAHLLLNNTSLSLIDFRSQVATIGSADTGDALKENWCNRVAAEVIAPGDWLKREWSSGTEARQQIERIAHNIKVGRQMLAVRARDNGLISQTKLEELLEHYSFKNSNDSRGREVASPANTAIKRCGIYFSRCVLDAYQDGFIEATEIYDLVGLKLKYLSDFAKKLDYPLLGWR